MTALSNDSDLRARIDEFFRTSFATDNPLITEAIRRMLAAGGKRLRPRIALLSASACGGEIDAALPIAAYMELIHVATLIHDDVVDQAEQRRGVNATAVDFGNRISVLAGDYLFAWIFKNVTAKYPAPVPHILSATLAAICDGEVLQLRSLDNVELSIDAYTEIVAKKTASLFDASARCAAILAGGDEREIEALAAYGEAFGIAFQMRDDLLDFTAESSDVGKPVGHDMIERKVTLPVILALAHGSAAERSVIETFYAGSDNTPAEAIAAVVASGALARTQDLIARHVERACAALGPVRSSRDELEALARTLCEPVVSVEVAATLKKGSIHA